MGWMEGKEQLVLIETMADLQGLVRQGFSDWGQVGDVGVKGAGDLLLFSYTSAAQYAGRWNFLEQVSRGLILQAKTGEVVARPFDKFFNWGEGGRKAPYTAHIVTVMEKLDGSLGILYRDNGYKVATRGSFPATPALMEADYNRWAEVNAAPQKSWSDLLRYGAMKYWREMQTLGWPAPASFASTWATDFLARNHDLRGLPDELTLLFEIIHADGRVLVDYGDREELVLLAARNRHTGDYLPFYPDLYELGQRYGFGLPRTFQANNMSDLIAQTGQLDLSQEGWVVAFSNGERYKIKGDLYLELHRLVSGLSFKNTLQAVMDGRVEQTRRLIPEEFLEEFNGWVAEINDRVAVTKAIVERAFAAAPTADRKGFALWVQTHHQELGPYLFARLDGREIEPLIYKLVFRER